MSEFSGAIPRSGADFGASTLSRPNPQVRTLRLRISVF